MLVIKSIAHSKIFNVFPSYMAKITGLALLGLMVNHKTFVGRSPSGPAAI